jgi:hypothetical protein
MSKASMISIGSITPAKASRLDPFCVFLCGTPRSLREAVLTLFKFNEENRIPMPKASALPIQNGFGFATHQNGFGFANTQFAATPTRVSALRPPAPHYRQR